MRRSLEELFWPRVAKSEGCWLWTGPPGSNGYGKVGKPTISAHRASWRINIGPIPDGVLVLHRCDNRMCVRPDHLFLGTHAENSADMVAKGRQARGDTNGNRKLCEEDAKGILDYLADGIPGSVTARMFNVSQSTVSAIRKGRLWSYLTSGARA